mmetsp:Transcript_38290/g.113503  ORF Transcript_38290/g.113503 Transcript_38290/m.113503 type:complete len:571 (+) Transcript_38290:2077-3789(+)
MVRDTRLGVSRNVSDTLVALLNLLTVAHRVGVHAVLVARVHVLVLAERVELLHTFHTIKASLLWDIDEVVQVDDDVVLTGRHRRKQHAGQVDRRAGTSCRQRSHRDLKVLKASGRQAALVRQLLENAPCNLQVLLPENPRRGSRRAAQVGRDVAVCRAGLDGVAADGINRDGQDRRARVRNDVDGPGDVAAHVAHLLDGRAIGAVVRVPVQQRARGVFSPRGQLGHVDAAADDLGRVADPRGIQQVVLERICQKAVHRRRHDALPAQLTDLERGNAGALAACPVVRAHRAPVQVVGHAVDALVALKRVRVVVSLQLVAVGAAPRISDVDVLDARIALGRDRSVALRPVWVAAEAASVRLCCVVNRRVNAVQAAGDGGIRQRVGDLRRWLRVGEVRRRPGARAVDASRLHTALRHREGQVGDEGTLAKVGQRVVGGGERGLPKVLLQAVDLVRRQVAARLREGHRKRGRHALGTLDTGSSAGAVRGLWDVGAYSTGGAVLGLLALVGAGRLEARQLAGVRRVGSALVGSTGGVVACQAVRPRSADLVRRQVAVLSGHARGACQACLSLVHR